MSKMTQMEPVKGRKEKTENASKRFPAHPDRLKSYFRVEAVPLLLVTVSGIFYNVGMIAGPYFEGQLAQCLFDMIRGIRGASAMFSLAALYLLVILTVQGMRAVKRFYVRRFANDTARNMRRVLYHGLIRQSRRELEEQGSGAMMTRAVADVDACTEGMRKFTTEVFDTGVVLVAYLCMLFVYDWRLTLLSCACIPLAYILAQALKKPVYRFNTAYKASADRLNTSTLDRISHALLYRVYGCDGQRNASYEEHLSDYEKKASAANIWENTMRPLYKVISLTGVVFIVYFGSKNISGTGWTKWNIAAFATYLSCFTKLAGKSSGAAKLFNAIQKAQVSWRRIKPLLHRAAEETAGEAAGEAAVEETEGKTAGKAVAEENEGESAGEAAAEGIEGKAAREAPEEISGKVSGDPARLVSKPGEPNMRKVEERNVSRQAMVSVEHLSFSYPEDGQAYPPEPDNDVLQKSSENGRFPEISADEDGQPQSDQPQSDQPQSGQPQSGQPQSGQPQSDQPQSDLPAGGHLRDISFQAAPGEIVGITGPVACGKSTLGRIFLMENPYQGSVKIGGRELSALSDDERSAAIGYMGHQPELMSDTLEENICLGDPGDLPGVLRTVCLDGEVRDLPEGVRTSVGSGGVQLSGGQQARCALARTLYRRHSLYVLDDPFSAVDRAVEEKIMQNLRSMAGESTILFISHRLHLFPQCDKIIWLENGRAQVSTHRELLQKNPAYARYYATQESKT